MKVGNDTGSSFFRLLNCIIALESEKNVSRETFLLKKEARTPLLLFFADRSHTAVCKRPLDGIRTGTFSYPLLLLQVKNFRTLLPCCHLNGSSSGMWFYCISFPLKLQEMNRICLVHLLFSALRLDFFVYIR